MTPKIKKIIFTLLALVILFVLYAIFKPDAEKISLTDGISAPANSFNSAEAQEIGNQITQALVQIKQITLDTSIFDSEVYTSLKDRSQLISDEPIGRPNPFAPLGSVSVISSATSSTGTMNKINTTATSSSSKTSTSTVNR